MSLVSFEFILFALVSILIYYLAPKKYQWLVLLAVSCYFYIRTAGVYALIIFMLTTAAAYGGAMWIAHAEGDKSRRRMYLLVFVVLAAGVLTFFKLANYREWALPEQIVMPLGISYYTFSLISYVADVYWKKDEPETDYLKLLLYAIYFPKILEGPISRHGYLSKQLYEGHSFDYQSFCFGVQLAIYGYFKKMVIADRASIFTNAVMINFTDNPTEHGGALLLLTISLMAVSLYCDFSGCMDIIGGISSCMGIRMESNFNHPFFSTSAAEFWRRWHITLGTWFKDYVYMPLVISPRVIHISKWVRDRLGKRAGKAVLTVIPLTVVWLLTGLWHGTGRSYVYWGMYWGSIIMLSSVFEPELKRLIHLLHINTETVTWKLFRQCRTFLIFSLGLVISRKGLKRALYIPYLFFFRLRTGELADDTLYSFGLDHIDFLILSIGICAIWRISLYQEKGSVREMIASWNCIARWMFYAASVIFVLLVGIYGVEYDTSTFAYMQF